MAELARLRRLRKMRQEFMPAAFSFSVSARVLCVGSAVVYRVALALTSPASSPTSASTTASASASPSRPSNPSLDASGAAARTQEWVIAMSRAKFCTFLSQVHAILQHPSVRHQLSTSLCSSMDMAADDWRPFDAFLQRMASLLDRHAHLPSWAFSNEAASLPLAADARAGLEFFLADCWRALETVLPALVVEPYDAGHAASREVRCVYLLLRDLLQFPEAVLAANCAYANAILSLEEVDDVQLRGGGSGVGGAGAGGHSACSICLDTVQRPVGGAESASAGVRLPCAHAFHEYCIMAWLRQSATCPQCRAPVGLHSAFGA